MNTLDIVILIILILSNVNGMRQGLVKALAGLIGWFLALLLAIRLSPKVVPFMAQYTADPTMQKIAAFASIIFVVLVLTWLAAHMLHKLLAQIKLSWLNRLAGGGFGLAKSVIIVLVLMHGLAPWFSQTKVWQNSKMVEMLAPYSAITTEYTQKVVQKTAEEFEQPLSDEDSKGMNQNSNGSSTSQVDNPFL